MLQFENHKVEFKQEYVEDLNKEVIAFANTEGGTVYIGIQKDGSVVGLENPDEISQKAANSLRDSILPDLMPFLSIRTLEVEGKWILAIQVSPGTNRPYYIRKKGLKPSGVYVRKGSCSQPISDEGIRQMIQETSGESYEEGRSLYQDLTFQTLQEEMKKRDFQLEEPQMKTLHMIGEDGLYTNLAYLLSDLCPSMIKIAWFQGKDKEIFRDREEFSGSLLKQMEDAYTYINRMNKTSATFTGLVRNDTKDYPEEAIREALLNSICHRDYGVSASNIINLYEDRMEFVSQGGIVPGLTIESLYLGISKPRNKYLAQLFFRMRLIESYGTGISKIQKAYSNSLQKPKFETAPGVFRVTLPNLFESTKTKQKIIESYPDSMKKEEEKQKILAYAKQKNQITRQEVEKILNIRTTKAYTLLKELCLEGELQAQGSSKKICYVPMNSNQKYPV